ncbi:hypothetical protein NDA16_002900 [Ustilago loliicola]|nr:hypothetical protein NDA16_002900 [Ustilago loliicola]
MGKDATGVSQSQPSSSSVAHQEDAESDSDDASSYDSEDSEVQDTLQADDRLQMLEANQLMHLNTAPQSRCPFALKDVYTEWHAMTIDNRHALIQEIRDALPSPPQTMHLLHDVYVKRLHSIHGNVVYIPTVQVILTELLTDPSFEQRDRYAFGQITTALMVIFAAL